MQLDFIFLKGYSDTIVSFVTAHTLLFERVSPNYTQRLISAVFVSTQIISKPLLRDGCIVTNECVEVVCENSQTETRSHCRGKKIFKSGILN